METQARASRAGAGRAARALILFILAKPGKASNLAIK